jgi:hypothetical protein
MIGLTGFTDEHSINAQMMRGDRGGGSGNMNTSLTEAMAIAEQSVGNNSIAIAAFEYVVGNDTFAIAALGEDRAEDRAGNLVHSIILDTPGRCGVGRRICAPTCAPPNVPARKNTCRSLFEIHVVFAILQYYIGCSGWSYSSWQGPFYPKGIENSKW